MAVEMNELIAVGADSVVAAGGVLTGIFVEVVVEGLAPVLAFLDLAGAQEGEVGLVGQQGSAEGFLVHEALVEPAVLTHVEALVGGVDDEGVVP